MPHDLDGDSEDADEYGDMDEEGEADIFGNQGEENDEKEAHSDSEDLENDVFAMARENKEMDNELVEEAKETEAAPVPKGKSYANEEMVEKITKIEDEMMDDKKWQLKGEVACKDRNYNSLLEEYVDFDTATKLPPQITKETTNNIEAMIKQRILDELFDDPIRKI